MPDELLVILGVEATMLIFIAAMTLHVRRTDVLSGRFFEPSSVTRDKGHLPQSLRAGVRDLLPLMRSRIRINPFSLSLWGRLARSLQSGLRTALRRPSLLAARFRRAGTAIATDSGRNVLRRPGGKPGALRRTAPSPSAHAVEALLFRPVKRQRSLKARSA
ncbi:MAG: hypothetical protein QOG17_1538 [Gammaproteobacteria bacterium]|jgi:hypothetical protein|nr:hypothetical protein [Gammaproteobacteria bacterium]